MARRVGLSIAPGSQGAVPGGASNDLELDATGNLRLVYDAEAVGQHARQRLQFFRGEWFLDRTIGVDWFGETLGQREAAVPVVEATVKRVVLATPGVTSLLEISTSFDRRNRGAKVDRCVVQTEYGDTAAV